MTDFWLISVPLDKTSFTSLEKLKSTVAESNLASCCKFSIPELKVGTLDNLLSLSDDLSKLDALTESVMKKTCQCMREVMESSDNVLEKAMANGVDLLSYVTKFQWDRAKYPTALALRSLTDIINKQVSLVESELRSRAEAYHNVTYDLQDLEHKAEGSLHTRCLKDTVRREDLVESEYLTTLLVVVARGSYVQWERTYESLSEFVVPRSSRRLYNDSEGGIFSVILFRRAVAEFKGKALQSKFTVREFDFLKEEEQMEKMKRLSVDKKDQYGIFVRWLKVNFTEVFVAWIHLKALRVFVESVLRYGLPVSYQALLLQPEAKRTKRLREELASLFTHLDPTAAASQPDKVSCEIPGMTIAQQEYFSYICFEISINLLETS